MNVERTSITVCARPLWPLRLGSVQRQRGEASMTTSTALLDKILSDENLDRACKQVVRNNGSEGVDGMKAKELPEYIGKNKEEMIDKIRRRKYRPLPVKRVQIPKEDGSKRNLGVPAVKDRWIEQATCQILSPIFEPTFSRRSYGFRPGRCAEQAILKAMEYMDDGYDWIVDMDLSKFFDNVDQDILMILVHKVIKDPDVESLVRRFLQGGVLVEGTFEETEKGTAQGSPISPLLANIYLNEFDHELEARGLRFTRYADDCIICVRSEAAANRVMGSVTKWLDKHLRVTVNVTKAKVARPNNIKYLGFSFYKTKGNKWHSRPHEKSVKKLEYKLVPLLKRNWGVSMGYRIQKINQVIRGWVHYFRSGDMKMAMIGLDQWIRRCIRVIYWKTWKTIRNRANHLVALGVSKRWAWMWANSRKGCYVNGLELRRWITNDLLKKKGLLSLADRYRECHCSMKLRLDL